MVVIDSHIRSVASPEATLFWASASPWPDTTKVASLVGGADLRAVAEVAEGHRVGPLVLRSLRAAGVDVGAEACLDRLRAEAGLRLSQERLLLSRALDLALSPLIDAGMRPTLINVVHINLLGTVIYIPQTCIGA